MSKRLYFDIETSYNLVATHAIGTKMFIGPEAIVKERAIICICWKWEHGKEVQSLAWDKKQNDKAMLARFVKVASDADEIVGHNGDAFDIKWIRTRCMFHRIPCMPDYVSIDTLKEARKLFRMNSNKLDYIGKYLGLGGKKKHDGRALWDDVDLKNDRKRLTEMVAYCKQDVKLLEGVHKIFLPYTKAKTHRAMHNGGYRIDCPECTSENTHVNKTRTSAAGTKKKQLHCKDCGKIWTLPERRKRSHRGAKRTGACVPQR